MYRLCGHLKSKDNLFYRRFGMDTVVEQKTVVQGRWGFYPCNRETYKKLKRLNFLSLLSKQADNRYACWANKLPHNRVSRKWTRNEQGQKIGCEIGQPLPEPKNGFVRFKDRINLKVGFITLRDAISQDYRNARYPKLTAEQVSPLFLRSERIDFWLAEAETWFQQ
jgi:hypothetical protein